MKQKVMERYLNWTLHAHNLRTTFEIRCFVAFLSESNPRSGFTEFIVYASGELNFSLRAVAVVAVVVVIFFTYFCRYKTRPHAHTNKQTRRQESTTRARDHSHISLTHIKFHKWHHFNSIRARVCVCVIKRISQQQRKWWWEILIRERCQTIVVAKFREK